MITLKDLVNRVYSDKICIRFEYNIPIEGKYLVIRFGRNPERIAEWNMQVVLDRTRDKDSEVYNFGYVMPKDDLPLELIAATGLKFLQLYLKEEVQGKSNLEFTIGEIIKGM